MKNDVFAQFMRIKVLYFGSRWIKDEYPHFYSYLKWLEVFLILMSKLIYYIKMAYF